MINKKVSKISCLLSVLLLQTPSNAMYNIDLSEINLNEAPFTPKSLNLKASTYIHSKQRKIIIENITKQANDRFFNLYQNRPNNYNVNRAEFKTYEDMKNFVTNLIRETLTRNKLIDCDDENGIKNIYDKAVNDLVKYYKHWQTFKERLQCFCLTDLWEPALDYANGKAEINDPKELENAWKPFDFTILNNSIENGCAILGLEKRMFDYDDLVSYLGKKNACLLGGMRFVVAFTKKRNINFYLFSDHYQNTAIELICHEK